MKLLFALIAALAAAPAFAQSPSPMPGMTPEQHAAMSASGRQGAQATGQIKSVDAKAGTVTIHHSPIAALGWPAMTMTFKAAPDVLKAAKPGATVTFTLNAAGDQVLAIR